MNVVKQRVLVEVAANSLCSPEGGCERAAAQAFPGTNICQSARRVLITRGCLLRRSSQASLWRLCCNGCCVYISLRCERCSGSYKLTYLEDLMAS